MDRCRSRLVLPNSTTQRLLIYRRCSVRTCARSQTVYALARAQHVSRAPSALIASAGQSGAAPRRAGAAIACVSRGPVTHSAGCAGHCFLSLGRALLFVLFLSFPFHFRSFSDAYPPASCFRFLFFFFFLPCRLVHFPLCITFVPSRRWPFVSAVMQCIRAEKFNICASESLVAWVRKKRQREEAERVRERPVQAGFLSFPP